MHPELFWKNFALGEELSISGNFIYDGLRSFHELKKLDYADELFGVFYDLSVGFERLLKIAVVMLEHSPSTNQDEFEKTLITHNHLELLRRIKAKKPVPFGCVHVEFLSLLMGFYKSSRYGRFTLKAINYSLDAEKLALYSFLSKHLSLAIKPDSFFGVMNDDRYRKFVRNIAVKTASGLFEIIEDRARELNIFTYEQRSGSKAETVFLAKADLPTEDILWKELLIFFMNTKETSAYLKFLRETEPLNFDPGLIDDYLDCFQSDSAKSMVRDELEALYEDIENPKDRLARINAIGAGLCFAEEDDEEDLE